MNFLARADHWWHTQRYLWYLLTFTLTFSKNIWFIFLVSAVFAYWIRFFFSSLICLFTDVTFLFFTSSCFLKITIRYRFFCLFFKTRNIFSQLKHLLTKIIRVTEWIDKWITIDLLFFCRFIFSWLDLSTDQKMVKIFKWLLDVCFSWPGVTLSARLSCNLSWVFIICLDLVFLEDLFDVTFVIVM